jgi:hypothetical protein
MQFTFHKGHHRPRPWYWLKWFPVLINVTEISRRVVLTFDSKYELDRGDQADVNKLFGISYGLNPKRNSDRFGWNWDTEKQLFFFYAFSHINGEMVFDVICSAVANHFYDLKITWSKGTCRFYVYNENGETIGYHESPRERVPSICYLLGPYFGGNRTPDKTISIELKKI